MARWHGAAKRPNVHFQEVELYIEERAYLHIYTYTLSKSDHKFDLSTWPEEKTDGDLIATLSKLLKNPSFHVHIVAFFSSESLVYAERAQGQGLLK